MGFECVDLALPALLSTWGFHLGFHHPEEKCAVKTQQMSGATGSKAKHS